MEETQSLQELSMTLDDLLEAENLQIDERLRDIMAAGALAGLLAVNPAAAKSSTPAYHQNFPSSLKGLKAADPEDRKAAFVKTMLPLIDEANKKIAADRARLVQLLRQPNINERDRAWIASQEHRYNADNTKDLLTRMDVVPPSLVLAQAAVESGWATDTLAKKHLSFFGQRAWTKRGTARGKYGERYQQFSSPVASIDAYIRNLNSHSAYQGFRNTRAAAKRAGKPATGVDLAATLTKYSTRGTAYTSQLQNMIRNNNWLRFDQR